MPENVKKIRELADFNVNTEISRDDLLIVATGPDTRRDSEGNADPISAQTLKVTIEAIITAYNKSLIPPSGGGSTTDPSERPNAEVPKPGGGTYLQDTTPFTAANLELMIKPGCGIEVVEECHNASEVSVDCSSTDLKYKTKKLCLNLSGESGGLNADRDISLFHEKQIPLGAVNTDNPLVADFQGYMTRKFLRNQYSIKKTIGVISSYSIGCGDFMSDAIYNEGANAWVKANSQSGVQEPISPPDSPVSSTDKHYIKEFYTMYKRFGAKIDFGTFRITPEFGPTARAGIFHGVHLQSWPFYDSTEQNTVVLGKAYIGSNFIYSELSVVYDLDNPGGILDVWMYLGDAGWVRTQSADYPVFWSEELWLIEGASQGDQGWFHWELDPNGGYRLKNVYLYQIPGQSSGVGGWTTIDELEAFIVDNNQTPSFDTSKAAPSTSPGTFPNLIPSVEPG